MPREFRRRVDARARRGEAEQDAEWGRALMIVNHLRTLLNKPMAMGQKRGRLKPLTLEGLKKRSRRDPSAAGTRADFEALVAEIERRKAAASRAAA